MKPLLFHFPDDARLARSICERIDAQPGELEWHLFPDRESLVTLKTDCANRDVVFVCSLTRPDAKTLPLYFAADVARELKARRVGLVAPYLGYMRQDHRFARGQAVSAHAYARLLSTTFDWVVAVDPHLHRIKTLDEIFTIPATAVSAMPAISDWIGDCVTRPVIIGPDLESGQWVQQVATELDAPFAVLEKTRYGDRNVKVSAVDPLLLNKRTPVLLDDIASSGHTLAEALKSLAPHGLHDATCVVVHGLFGDGAEALVRDAGATRIASTNTVAHSTNAIDVSALIAVAVNSHLKQ